MQYLYDVMQYLYDYNPFIFTILFGLLESSRITLFKILILEKIEVKVTEKCKKISVFRDLGHNYLSEKIIK